MSSPRPRLRRISDGSADIVRPAYDPSAHGSAIVHIGVGAFHRAHQAVYTDTALSAWGGPWRITGISPRSVQIADALNGQNGLFTVLERGPGRPRLRMIGSIARVIAHARDPDSSMSALCRPTTRVVSMTVTEKAYGFDRHRNTIDETDAAIASDLRNPARPDSVIGMLTEALRRRRALGIDPFAVLCCDNLPDNGALVKTAVCSYAALIDTGLSQWIAENVAFPSTMVDRITPASDDGTYGDVAEIGGYDDLAAVETEPFSQWVIEDRFPTGRPAWDHAGALFVPDVAPYERMKLRMLNGAHSLLAYAGHVAGFRYVRDVMADADLAALVDRYLRAAADTLEPVPGIDLETYRAELVDRFANPAIAHETYQICMDGTQKLPQRILESAAKTAAGQGALDPFAFAVAAWIRYCSGVDEAGAAYSLRDPREEELEKIWNETGHAPAQCVRCVHGLAGLFPPALASNTRWLDLVVRDLTAMNSGGMRQAVAKFLAGGHR